MNKISLPRLPSQSSPAIGPPLLLRMRTSWGTGEGDSASESRTCVGPLGQGVYARSDLSERVLSPSTGLRFSLHPPNIQPPSARTRSKSISAHQPQATGRPRKTESHPARAPTSCLPPEPDDTTSSAKRSRPHAHKCSTPWTMVVSALNCHGAQG